MVNTVSITRIRTLSLLVLTWLGFGYLLPAVFAQQIGLFYHSDYVQIEEGNIFAEGSNMNASLQMLGYEMNLINEFNPTNILESDLIIIPELERKNLFLDLNENQKNALRNYVSNGGGIIISGVVAPNEANADNATDILNGVFDFSIETSEVALTGKSAKDTQSSDYGFSNSPEIIPNNNSVAFITGGLPASSVSIYSDIENESYSSVSILKYGDGHIVYLGWGWWNATPNGTQDGGWLEVLESSINLLACTAPELNLGSESVAFNLDASKEITIESEDLPLIITSCTENYNISFDKALFTCDDLGKNEIEITLEDKIGRSISKRLSIEISDNDDFCSAAPAFTSLNGSVSTTKGDPLEATQIQLKGQNTFNTNSDQYGRFNISDIPTGTAYDLRATKDTKYLNGVSTFDMVLLSKHLNGLSSFNDPYQFIAADVNNSGTISVKDLVELRSLILFQTEKFENQKSWQIINNNVDLSDPLSPDVDKNDIYQAGTIVPNLDFTGVKIGDINATASPNRNKPEINQISIKDLYLQKGQIVTIPIKLQTSNLIAGFQIGLKLESGAISFSEINTELNDFGQQNFNLIENKLLMSWVSKSKSNKTDEVTLQVKILVEKEGFLSEYFTLSTENIDAELYDQQLDVIKLKLHFEEVADEAQDNEAFKVSHSPNPFIEFTDISFELQEASLLQFEVYSTDGRVVFSKTKNFEKGHQKIRINAQDISNPGIYYYSIIHMDGQKTTNTLIKM